MNIDEVRQWIKERSLFLRKVKLLIMLDFT